MNAIRIIPSMPIDFANGSRRFEQYERTLYSPIKILDINQINNPAGAATSTARPKTKRVLSNTERTITFPIWGRLYGGNSKRKEDENPFKMVLESNFDVKKVTITPINIVPVSIKVDINVLYGNATVPAKNIEIIEINVGNLPLHGTKLFVKIAIKRSRGESMILQPITPQALQPNPMHMVSACFPCALAFLKNLSRLKAIRGKYPESSSNVKSGKNIAIGGNITETTQARVLYIPKTSKLLNH